MAFTLFSHDTRTRNTIYIGQKASTEAPQCFTTRLHRWFGSQRPFLFTTLSYAPFSLEPFDGIVPKVGSERLLQALESLLKDKPDRFQNDLAASRGGCELHFKTTAYNWLTFCTDMPPALGPDGEAVAQTKYGTARFRDRASRDLALLLANGKLMFLWWCGVGDDFDLTKTGFVTAPFGAGKLPEATMRSLLAMVPSLQSTMAENVAFKRNAGKNIGNYNLARCRDVTDKADRLWLEAVGLSDLWEDIELEHSLVVRTSFDEE